MNLIKHVLLNYERLALFFYKKHYLWIYNWSHIGHN